MISLLRLYFFTAAHIVQIAWLNWPGNFDNLAAIKKYRLRAKAKATHKNKPFKLVMTACIFFSLSISCAYLLHHRHRCHNKLPAGVDVWVPAAYDHSANASSW